MLNEYVPLGSVNEMVFVVDVSVLPLNVTDHEVPEGRPDSMNVISYVTKWKETDMFKFDPLTVNDPEDGFGK